MTLSNKKKLKSSAEVVDKHLILSLPNATEPIIWRMALDKIGTASFEIKQTKDSNVYKLILKPQKGAAETIAPFDSKDEALQALLQASDALQKPETTYVESKKQPSKSLSHANDYKSNLKWIYLLISLFSLIAVYLYMRSLVPNKINGLDNSPRSTMNSLTTNEPEAGVPMSADDFLNGIQ